jgi:hypothetical protein
MRYLRQNTAVIVSVGPFLDYADGLTPKDTMTVTGITAVLVYDDDDGTAPNHTTWTCAASGSDNDLVATGHCGMWECELTAANTNFTGRAMLCFTDPDQICPVFHEFQVLTANVYDSLFTGAGPTGDLLDINVTQWLGTAAHAATVNGVPVVQLHDSAGAGGINAPANFEDLSIANTTVAGGTALPTFKVNFAPSGGAVFGGTVVVELNYTIIHYDFTMLGGAVAGGVVDVVKGQSFTISGGTVLGGANVPVFGLNFDVSGGAVSGGAPTITFGFLPTCSGGTVLGGALVPTFAFIPVSTGGAVLGGDVVVDLNSLIFATFTMSGGTVMGGSFTVSGSSLSVSMIEPSFEFHHPVIRFKFHGGE